MENKKNVSQNTMVRIKTAQVDLLKKRAQETKRSVTKELEFILESYFKN